MGIISEISYFSCKTMFVSFMHKGRRVRAHMIVGFMQSVPTTVDVVSWNLVHVKVYNIM